jgi:hypothetical protein
MTRYLIIAIACVFGRALAAQAPDTSDGSVTVSVVPQEPAKNGTVAISGLAYPLPGKGISVTVTPPSGTATTVTITPNASGHYTSTFAKTGAEGEYKVTVQAGAKDAPAHASFTVHSYLVDIDEDVADNKSLLEESASFVTALKKGIDNMPDSPARTDMEAKLAPLDEETQKLPAQSAQLAKALANVKQMMTEHPDAAPTLQPFFDHLAELDEHAKEERKDIDKEIAESEKALATCDAIDHATYGLKAVPQILAITKRPFEFAVAFFTNMAASVAPQSYGSVIAVGGKMASGLATAVGSAKESLAENGIELGSESEIAERLVDRIPESVRSTPAYKFVVAESKSFLPDIADGLGEQNGSLHLFTIVTKLATDIAAYANEQLFAQYCEKFEGPFTATMEAHFYAKPQPDGRIPEWWSFTTSIAGKMVLRYPKSAAGKAVALSGEIEGGATRFTYKENVFDGDLFGKMAKGGVVHLIDVPPAATDDAKGGMVNSMSSPTAFFIPVTGQFANGAITLTLGDARTDFNETYTKAHTVYVVTAPSTLMLPVMGHFTLPYKDAHWIVYSAMDFKDAAPVLTVASGAKAMTVDRTFDTRHPGTGNLGHYTMHLTLCNPGCAK